MSYSVLHVVHLLAAIFFIGTLFFEVMILSRIRPQIGEQTMPLVERAVGARSRVVLFVYGAGIGLGWYHREALANPLASSFATLLSLKVVLAIGVFFTFGLVAILLRKGRMTPTRYRPIHWAILLQMIGIVLLAKGMFYVHW
jgi:hypothetical protein